MTVRPYNYGRVRVPLMFSFTRGKSNKFRILREVVYKAVHNVEIFSELQPVTPYIKPKKKETTRMSVVRSDNLPDIE